MEPKLGMSVHFYQGGFCYAAIIVAVWSKECVNLHVLPSGRSEPVAGALSAQRVATSVPYSNDVHPRDWSWHFAE